jgi:general secretion pathway protein C
MFKVVTTVPLSETFSSLTHHFAKLPQKRLAQLVTAILLIYLAYLMAQFTWLMLDNAKLTSVTPSFHATPKSSAQTSVNLVGLTQLNLFGQYNAQPKAEVITQAMQEAPETKLNLTLTGVVASDVAGTGAAIIENGGKQETYGIGDTITGTRATLDKVLNDRVIIKQTGNLETLMLDGFKYQKLSAPASHTISYSAHEQSQKLAPIGDEDDAENSQIDQRDNKELTASVATLREDIGENPGKISDYLRIAPFTSDGKIVGYQLSPGNNEEFFQQSGLQTGDIAVQLNGLDLSDPKQAAQALQTLREEQEITLTVEREGDLTDILFSIAN